MFCCFAFNLFIWLCFIFSDGRDAAKGLAAFELDDTYVKLVVAFDVDGNRQEASVLKYKVEVNTNFIKTITGLFTKKPTTIRRTRGSFR